MEAVYIVSISDNGATRTNNGVAGTDCGSAGHQTEMLKRKSFDFEHILVRRLLGRGTELRVSGDLKCRSKGRDNI